MIMSWIWISNHFISINHSRLDDGTAWPFLLRYRIKNSWRAWPERIVWSQINIIFNKIISMTNEPPNTFLITTDLSECNVFCKIWTNWAYLIMEQLILTIKILIVIARERVFVSIKRFYLISHGQDRTSFVEIKTKTWWIHWSFRIDPSLVITICE